MSQFKDFNCVVTNGSAVVRAVWEVTHGAVSSGPFNDGEALTWGVDGVGVILSDDTTTMKARFTRTSGAEPAVSDTITGAGGANAVISQMDILDALGNDINPPRFADSPAQGTISQNDFFVVNSAADAGVFGILSATFGRDSFTLAANWSGTTLTDVAGYITRDFTPNNNWPLTLPGDLRAAAIIRRALMLADTLDVVGDWKDVTNDSVSGWQGSWQDKTGGDDYTVRWRNEHGRVILSGVAERSPASTEGTVAHQPHFAEALLGANFATAAKHIEFDTALATLGTDVLVNVTTPINQTSGVYSKGRFKLVTTGKYLISAHVHISDAYSTGGLQSVASFRDATTGTPVTLQPSLELWNSQAVGAYDALKGSLSRVFDCTVANSLIDLYLTDPNAEVSNALANRCSMRIEKIEDVAWPSEINELLFTLPVGDRPRYQVVIPVTSQLVVGSRPMPDRIVINSSGVVRYRGYGDASAVDLSHVSFTTS
jgi:hypothetical protein